MNFLKNKLTIFLATLVLLGGVLGLLSQETVNNMYLSWIKDTSISKDFEGLVSKNLYSDEEIISDELISTNYEEVANFIKTYNSLPQNFITKEQAFNEGWKIGDDLWSVAENKSLGGSIFKNLEGKLPNSIGREYRECDINYNGGNRGSERLVYSNDGLIFLTKDHYQTFIEV
ncbi:MAG: ribonuclease domain-containing protein [Clostridium sp.]